MDTKEIEKLEAEVNKSTADYYNKNVKADAFQIFGVLVSSLALAFTILELSRLEVAELLVRLYGSFRLIADFVYNSIFFWVNIDVPTWIRSSLSMYLVIGATTARTAVLYFSQRTGCPTIQNSGNGLLYSNSYLGFLGKKSSIFGFLKYPLFFVFIAPIWPYLLASNYTKIVYLNDVGKIVKIKFRRAFLRMLAFTLLGALFFIFANMTATPYGYITPKDVTVDESKPHSQQAIVISKNGLRHREEMNTSSKIIQIIPNGFRLEVLESDNNGWSNVEFKEHTGYVSSKYIKIFSGQSSKIHVPIKTIVVSRIGLKFREGRTTSTKIIRVLPNGYLLEILGTDENNWAESTIEHKIGYVSTSYLKILETVQTNKPVIKAEVVSDIGLKFREGKSTFTQIIKVLPNGFKTTVRSTGLDGWSEITVGDRTGFVYSKYLRFY